MSHTGVNPAFSLRHAFKNASFDIGTLLLGIQYLAAAYARNAPLYNGKTTGLLTLCPAAKEALRRARQNSEHAIIDITAHFFNKFEAGLSRFTNFSCCAIICTVFSPQDSPTQTHIRQT